MYDEHIKITHQIFRENHILMANGSLAIDFNANCSLKLANLLYNTCVTIMSDDYEELVRHI